MSKFDIDICDPDPLIWVQLYVWEPASLTVHTTQGPKAGGKPEGSIKYILLISYTYCSYLQYYESSESFSSQMKGKISCALN